MNSLTAAFAFSIFVGGDGVCMEMVVKKDRSQEDCFAIEFNKEDNEGSGLYIVKGRISALPRGE